MKLALVMAAVLVLPVITMAQMDANRAPQAHPPAASAGPAAPGFPFPGGFTPPAGLFDQFWNDPAIAAELHLTEAQRRQLQAAALAQQLSLIDGGADGLKALARLSALLDADQLDDAAYKQQINNLAAVAGKLVQDVGDMAAAPRRILTLEQWRKLQSLQRARARSSAPPRPAMQPPPGGNRP